MEAQLTRSSALLHRSPAVRPGVPVAKRWPGSEKGRATASRPVMPVVVVRGACRGDKAAWQVSGRSLTRACSSTPAGVLVHRRRVVHHRAMPNSEGSAGVLLKRSVRRT